MLIEINDYTKTIHGATVLDQISLRMEGGKVYGLKGPNGCGKTMLMRAVCGLITPTSGSVVINGETLGKDISFPRSVGALLENPAFISNYSGFQNLKLMASIQDLIDDQTIEDAIAGVGLDPHDRKKYRKYSLGMKQRLGIANAIMENPELLILDEPLNALDKKGVALVHQILDHFRAQGAVVILACHDPLELASLSDEILLIENGRVIGRETPDHTLPAVMEEAP
ncbi:MAG: ATP-binding cassette domain-containing protein [Clostridiales bacterium]|nr:ATP-binding cassette domain-containing protein [Clostridiales bacterium]